MESTSHGGSDDTVTLRPVTAGNRPLVEDLRVAAGQESFVDGVTQSLNEAAATPHARPWYRAIYALETPVGFVMLGDDVRQGILIFPGGTTCGG
jgi:diamine N-acetyltransferase